MIYYAVKNARKVFRIPGRKTPFTAVNDVSLDIMSGETYGLVGESGCGKTTLVRMMLGLQPADQGEFILLGKAVNWKSRTHLLELYREVQMVFQDPYSSLNPRLRILEVFRELYQFLPGRDGTKSFEPWVENLFNQVGLSGDFLRRYPFQLSGGQRQRVAIARALSVYPGMLILDEAVSALDVSIQAQILELFTELQHKLNLTYMFISHNLAVIRLLANRVGIMLQGTLVEEGTAKEIYHHPQHPYSKNLLEVAEKIIVEMDSINPPENSGKVQELFPGCGS